MRRLRAYDGDPWTVYQAIVAEKRTERIATLLDELAPVVRKRYEEYESHESELEHLPVVAQPFDAAQCEALKHCYVVETQALKKLKARIKSLQPALAQATCQSCGIDRPGTFDHYLPKSLFPEFSVHAHNLVPCCHICNQDGGQRWLEESERILIHLYHDEIEENERFLVAHIRFDTTRRPSACFEVDASRGKNQTFCRRYERHCRNLGLFEHFRNAAPAMLDKWRNQARGLPQKNRYSVAKYFSIQADENQRLLGANNWEVALLAAAAESKSFIEYCLGDQRVVDDQ